jgi:hypothetical protein
MRTSLRAVPLLITAVFGSNIYLHAQSPLSLPGCEAVPEVRKIMDEKLEWNLLDKMKFAERFAYQRKILEDLMARYPREIAPVNSYANIMQENVPEEYRKTRDGWVQAARNYPDDPLALLVAGKALVGTNTPEAIRLLESAKSQAPFFPWPNLYLASTYATGKRADQAKTRQYIDAFYALCPSSTDGYARWLLS